MRLSTRTLVLASLLFTPAPSVLAQTAVDPSGHWEGIVRTPNQDIALEVDLARNGNGGLIGTINQPAERLKGLHLSNLAVDGAAIRFQIKGTPGERAFDGTLAADGKTMTGIFTQGGYTMPFNLTRTGQAQIEAAVRNAPLAPELEGSWNGTLDVKGTQLRLILTMTNEPGGATASIVNVDQGLEIPVSAITHSGSTLTLDLKAIGGSYRGELNKESAELRGTFSQGSGSVPLAFRRAAK